MKDKNPFANAAAFREACEKFNNPIDVCFFKSETDSKPFQDDGNLHVTMHGLRACFDLGQDLPRGQFNWEVHRILKELGLPVNAEALA